MGLSFKIETRKKMMKVGVYEDGDSRERGEY